MRWLLDLLYTIYFLSAVTISAKALEGAFWTSIIILHVLGYPLMAIVDVSYFMLHAKSRASGYVSLRKLIRRFMGNAKYYGLNYLLLLFFAYYLVSLLVLLVGYYGEVYPLVYYAYPVMTLYLLPFLLRIYIFPSMAYKAAHNTPSLTRGEKIRAVLIMGLPISLIGVAYDTGLRYLLMLYPNSFLLGAFYDLYRALPITILAAYYFDWIVLKSLNEERTRLYERKLYSR